LDALWVSWTAIRQFSECWCTGFPAVRGSPSQDRILQAVGSKSKMNLIGGILLRRRSETSSVRRDAVDLKNHRVFGLVAIGAVWMCSIGCTPPPQFRENALEWHKQERTARLEPGETFAVHHRHDVSDIVSDWFGTPDSPSLPLVEGAEDPLVQLFDAANLQRAAGPVVSRNEKSSAGLYRRHCSHCHGVTGDGMGPTASFLSPYPRDFRLGRFKFKSSPTGTPPTKADLKLLLQNGVPGTSMPSFRVLDDEELDALVDYVIYLSVRGMVERFLVAAVRDLDDDERLVKLPKGMRFQELPAKAKLEIGTPIGSLLKSDSNGGETKSAEASPEAESSEPSEPDTETPPTDSPESTSSATQTPFDPATVEEDLLYLVEEQLLPIAEKWLGILDYEPKEVDVPEWILDRSHSEYAAQIELGHKLYFGAANCVQCHGETGVGDGQTNNYDDWTNDWLKVEGLDPNKPEAWAAYVDAGAHPPRPIMPRNLRLGVYRGGDKPIDLFRRIQYGIEGTPMPASLTLTDEQVWALVAYVRQMPFEPLSRPASAHKSPNERPVR
jgi:mono/diheme cytochrome c family protein